MLKKFLRLFPYVRQLESNFEKALCGEMSLESLHMKDGKLNVALKSKIVPLVAECFYDILNESQALNFVEFSLTHLKSSQTIIVTVQKAEGKTPATLLGEAKQQLEDIQNISVWCVGYRGNQYGMFLSENIANEFAEFIKIRNDKLFNAEPNSISAIVYQITPKEVLKRANIL